MYIDVTFIAHLWQNGSALGQSGADDGSKITTAGGPLIISAAGPLISAT